jgi:hypothetical protein
MGTFYSGMIVKKRSGSIAWKTLAVKPKPRVAAILIIDGMHTGDLDGKPGPQESQLETDKLEIFVQFARDAVAGKKVTDRHSLRDFSGYFCQYHGNSRLPRGPTGPAPACYAPLGTDADSAAQ